jgi:hypothetical protein
MRIRQTWLRPTYQPIGVDIIFILAKKDLNPRETQLLK